MSLYWNPSREAFSLPFLGHPVMWYGLCFVAGFILGLAVLVPIFASTFHMNREEARRAVDRLCWFVILGMLIGARLGAVFFYDWPYFQKHPEEILKVWHGGLASHGGVIGVILAVVLFMKTLKAPQVTFIKLLDCIAIPSALVAFFIRIGNFINQEIVGLPSSLPWAVTFAHPAEGVAPVPRHPVQLYEATAYLATFFILYALWRKGYGKQPGFLVGLMFILIFGSRFVLEFWKATQTSFLSDSSFLQMGQLLSLPFILLGACFLLAGRVKSSPT